MKNQTMQFFLLQAMIIFFIGFTAYAQIPQIRTPHHATIPQYETYTHPNPVNVPQVSIMNPFFNRIQQNNESIMREVEENERRRQLQVQEDIQDVMRQQKIALPNFQGMEGTANFYTARDEINDMLHGRRPMNLKRAIFLCENAYYDNKMSYEKFNVKIQNLKNICLSLMEQEKVNWLDNVAKNMIIFRLITDEVSVNMPGNEKTLTHFPMKYDFEDFRGEKDVAKLMVSKLMATNSGQCHSLPLLYLILADELDTKASLCFSPQHSFVKVQDNQGNWYGLELTRGVIATDDYYMGSGFIHAEALRNELYLKPLSYKETIASVLNDLSFYYTCKYGYDEFVKQISDIVLAYHPTDLRAMIGKYNYNLDMFRHVLQHIGVPHPSILPEYPQAYALYQQVLKDNEMFDSLGYAKIPDDAYESWLESIKIENKKSENQLPILKQIEK